MKKPKKTASQRQLMAQRVAVEYLERIDKLAEKMERSPRQILEFALKKGLPDLEKEAGIEPPKP